ncbi:MAG: hypothetical protein LWW94_04565 [Candidatus Desulfofervidaceae bacterium]|nr:hypothetical protein [Candidatus Desulfofervidaceae bacterium]
MNKKVELKITDMTCVMCAKGIEANLNRMPEVMAEVLPQDKAQKEKNGIFKKS